MAEKTGWVHFRTEPELEKLLNAEVAHERRKNGRNSRPNRSTVGRALLLEALKARERRRTRVSRA